MDKMQKIRQEIERRMDKHWEGLPDADSPEDNWTHNELCELGAYKELEHIEDFLNSLQQELPVDLEKEMDKYYGMYRDKTGKTYDIKDDEPCFDWKEDELSEHERRIARYFYELGLNTRKEE